MAQGKSGYVEFSTNQNWAYVRVGYNQDYDAAKNASVVTITSIEAKYDSTTDHGTLLYLDGTIKINGVAVVTCNSSSGTTTLTMSTKDTWYPASGSVSGSATIYHDTDGSASIEISIGTRGYSYFYFHNDAYWTSFTVANGSSQTVQLMTIPRVSSISSALDVNIGSACSISWTPGSASFRYKLLFSMGNWSAGTSAIHPNTTSSYTYTGFDIPFNAAKQLPNATSGRMTVTLYTYSDASCNNQVGSPSSATFTVTVPSSLIPTVDSLSVSIDNSGNSTVNSWGLAVSGFSKVKITASASGAYGSSISSFYISDGYTANISGSSLSYLTGVITSSGLKTFSVECRDSRGRYSAVKTSDPITFYQYSKPVISSFTVSRSASNIKNIVVRSNWSYSSVNGKNSASAILYYKQTNSDSWIQYGSINRNVNITLGVEFNEYSSYDFRVIVTDTLSGSAQEDRLISTREVLLDFKAGGKGLGIGKICENDALEVSLPAVFSGGANIDIATIDKAKINGVNIGSINIWERLWVNSSPNDSFPAQVLISDASAYDTLMVALRYSTVYGYDQCLVMRNCHDASCYFPYTIIDGLTLTPKSRHISWYADTNEIYANPGCSDGTHDDTACVPIALYGIKKYEG